MISSLWQSSFLKRKSYCDSTVFYIKYSCICVKKYSFEICDNIFLALTPTSTEHPILCFISSLPCYFMFNNEVTELIFEFTIHTVKGKWSSSDTLKSGFVVEKLHNKLNKYVRVKTKKKYRGHQQVGSGCFELFSEGRPKYVELVTHVLMKQNNSTLQWAKHIIMWLYFSKKLKSRFS